MHTTTTEKMATKKKETKSSISPIVFRPRKADAGLRKKLDEIAKAESRSLNEVLVAILKMHIREPRKLTY